jgi:predicted O-methyltransferase YrrM
VTYDYTPFLKKIDLVVVDGDHSYKFVKSDSENAFKLLRPGGMILWDDYVWNPRHPECAGVAQFVNELKDTGRAFRIAGTRFAIYVDG